MHNLLSAKLPLFRLGHSKSIPLYFYACEILPLLPARPGLCGVVGPPWLQSITWCRSVSTILPRRVATRGTGHFPYWCLHATHASHSLVQRSQTHLPLYQNPSWFCGCQASTFQRAFRIPSGCWPCWRYAGWLPVTWTYGGVKGGTVGALCSQHTGGKLWNKCHENHLDDANTGQWGKTRNVPAILIQTNDTIPGWLSARQQLLQYVSNRVIAVLH